jgi:small subunit ribosomal protein S15
VQWSSIRVFGTRDPGSNPGGAIRNLFKRTKIKTIMAKTKISKKLEKPVWLKYTQKEVEAIILKLAGKGLTSEKIGLTLRDQYGIPKTKIYDIKISKILKENNKFIEPTTVNLEAKLQKVIGHYKKNKQDKKAERSLIITKAKLKKRQDYAKKKKKA